MSLKRLFYISILAIFSSCTEQEPEFIETEAVHPIEESNSRFIKEFNQLLSNEIIGVKNDLNITEAKALGKEVNLYSEFQTLFNPDNFDCGCTGKLKRQINKIKPKNKKKGFIPRVVLNNLYYNDTAEMLNYSAGINVLAHSIQFQKENGEKSNLIFVNNAVTKPEFEPMTYIEEDYGTYPNFLYTMDCSGYISTAVKASASFNQSSMKASAEAAARSDKSLFVLGGVMYSPLWEAYSGEVLFKKNDKQTLSTRIANLNAILEKVSDKNDSTEIYLHKNFQVIFSSNQGKSSFNGGGKLEAKSQASLGASISGGVDAGGEIKSKSSFITYSTYVTNYDINQTPPTLTIEDISSRRDSLQNQLDQMN
ncbi:hypothetical protein [Flammeovirga sp. EKP202]|uniref:hypothetical protein n=1 Tax=Flammeovirga sp. EKP202 TaxID=2770592 RepID=UPI00165FC5E3|nr:hypothetical protein [Flammeovirga sp. EKP202]MBD0399988.1 hypothetical protein [Flammeovirga sp. EKP202]